jgi:hypothetical protein
VISAAGTPNSAAASDMAFALASDGALGVGEGVGGRAVAVAGDCGAVVAVGAIVGAGVGVGAEVGTGTAMAVGATTVDGCVGTAVGSSSPLPQASARIISAEGINTIERRDGRNFINTD